MITEWYYNSNPDRSAILEKITGEVIDIGGSAGSSWNPSYVVDIMEPGYPVKKSFVGNANFPFVWEDVFKYVEEHGKFDFACATHFFEDISNPFYAAWCIERIAKRGLIIVPSKYIESGNFGGGYRGFIHHRWIWNMENGVLVGYPKINYFDVPKFGVLNDKASTHSELVIFWEGEIGMKLANDDFLGPTEQAVMDLYDNLINIHE